MRRFGALLVAVAFVAIAVSVAFAAQSPSRLRASIFAAARAQHSVHYVALTVAAFRAQIVGDASGDRGIQQITFVLGPKVGHATVRVVAGTAYIRGDAFTLHEYVGFSSAEASRYHDMWVSIPHASPRYAPIAAAVTFRSFLAELYPKGTGLVGVIGTVDGRDVVGVRVARRRAGLRVVSTLYARAHGTHLPVKEEEFAPGRGYHSWNTIGRWNEPVKVQAPAHAVPLSTGATG
jgi:hypothetical protein